jgi:ATP-binding cassette, subfamily C (CFTR/MRP), member 1
MGTTVVLATHAAHRLSYSDSIVALSAQGSVVEEGTFPTLMTKGGYVANLVVRHRAEEDEKINVNENDNGPDDSAREEQKVTSDEQAVPPKRFMRDRKVYQYYFSAAGWAKSALFFVLILGFAFFTRSQGTYYGSVNMRTDFRQIYGWSCGLQQ